MVSLLNRSIAFLRARRQRTGGISQHVNVSARLSRTIFAVFLDLIGSSSPAFGPVLAGDASRESMAWIAFCVVTCARFGYGTFAGTLRQKRAVRRRRLASGSASVIDQILSAALLSTLVRMLRSPLGFSRERKLRGQSLDSARLPA